MSSDTFLPTGEGEFLVMLTMLADSLTFRSGGIMPDRPRRLPRVFGTLCAIEKDLAWNRHSGRWLR